MTQAFSTARPDGLNLAIIDSPNAGLHRIYARIADRLRACDRTTAVQIYPSAQALRCDLAGSAQMDVLLCDGSFPLDAAFLSRTPRLRGVLSAITGVEGFDVAAASSHGVLLGNGAVFENWRSMAEATVLMILAAAYELNETQHILRAGLERPATRSARMLFGKTIGFIGFGQIARETARLLGDWGMKMLCHTRSELNAPDIAIERVELEHLLLSSDIVVVLAPLNADSRRMLDARRLALMKPSAVLINTARGGIIDEDALHQALASGQLAGAALDTFEVEPLPLQSPLRGIRRAVLTPHLIGHTAETFSAIEANAECGIRKLFAGKAPPCLLNPQALPAFYRKTAAVQPSSPRQLETETIS